MGAVERRACAAVQAASSFHPAAIVIAGVSRGPQATLVRSSQSGSCASIAFSRASTPSAPPASCIFSWLPLVGKEPAIGRRRQWSPRGRSKLES